MKDVTIGIPTKGRYELLANTLMSVALQTVTPKEVIIVDDSNIPTDIRTLQQFNAPLLMFNVKNISWRLVYGRKLGQHHSHQIVQDLAATPFILRVDDDEILEPNVLETLLKHIEPQDVGAVGGLVPQSVPPPVLPSEAKNDISNLNLPNIQWFAHPKRDIIEVDHLTSSFLYRKGIANFDLNLSPAAFREETLFTYEIKRKGYRLLVDPTIITWHFRAPERHQNIRDWENDDRFFNTKLKEWGINSEPTKIVVLDCGLGDHLIFAKILGDLKAKYKKVVIACCYPEAFSDHKDIELISIAEALSRFGDIGRWNIYKNCIDWNWRESLALAFRKLYEV